MTRNSPGSQVLLRSQQFSWTKVLSGDPEKILFPEKKVRKVGKLELPGTIMPNSKLANRIRERMMAVPRDEVEVPKELPHFAVYTPAMLRVTMRKKLSKMVAVPAARRQRSDSSYSSSSDVPACYQGYNYAMMEVVQSMQKRKQAEAREQLMCSRRVYKTSSRGRANSKTSDSQNQSVTLSKKRTVVRTSQEKTVVKMPEKKTVVRTPEENTTVRMSEKRNLVRIPAKRNVVRAPEKRIVVRAPEKRIVVRTPEKRIVFRTPEKRTFIRTPERRVIFTAPERGTVFASPERRTVLRTPEKRMVVGTPEKKTVVRTPEKKTVVRTPEKKTMVRMQQQVARNKACIALRTSARAAKLRAMKLAQQKALVRAVAPKTRLLRSNYVESSEYAATPQYQE